MMARRCAICDKRVTAGNQISHSHRKSKRTWSPNLQRVRVNDNGTPVRMNVCTRCLRSGKVNRSI